MDTRNYENRLDMRYLSLILLMAPHVWATTPWESLTQGATDANTLNRAHAIAALGTTRTDQAEKLVEAALLDKHSAVRLAAVSALAERKSLDDIPKLKAALDDTSGEVSFTAAKALWEMGDRSGRDLLAAVLAGEHRQSPGYIKRRMRDANSTLHSPKTLVWMGVKEGVGFLFGPAGYVVGLAEDMTKDSSFQARALTATLLAQVQDQEILDDLLDALSDKNPLVRAAAAKALGGFGDRKLILKLETLFEDKDNAVRYMAAASIVRIENGEGNESTKSK